MRLLVQWTRLNPQGWEAIDLAADRRAWERAPAKPLAGVLDDAPGWVYALGFQGIEFSGDHVAVEPIVAQGAVQGLRITTWNDDLTDWQPQDFNAFAWEILSPAPDPRFGGRMNTRQNLTVYASEPYRTATWPNGLVTSSGPVAFRPWEEFIPPHVKLTRHGVTTVDELARKHNALRAPVSWREWL